MDEAYRGDFIRGKTDPRAEPSKNQVIAADRGNRTGDWGPFTDQL